METFPVALGVNTTEQAPFDRTHLVALKVPVAPLEVNDTVPVATLMVPSEVSATVAVQVLPWLTGSAEGEQITVVEV